MLGDPESGGVMQQKTQRNQERDDQSWLEEGWSEFDSRGQEPLFSLRLDGPLRQVSRTFHQGMRSCGAKRLERVETRSKIGAFGCWQALSALDEIEHELRPLSVRFMPIPPCLHFVPRIPQGAEEGPEQQAVKFLLLFRGI